MDKFIELKLLVSQELHLAIKMRARDEGQKTNAAVVRHVLSEGLKDEVREARERLGRK